MNATLKTNNRINSVPIAFSGAILSAAIQAGQMIGSAMPDTEAGNVLKGVFDPMSNIGAGMAYMSEGKIGKGLISLIPGVGTYLQGKDSREEEARLKAIKLATEKRDFIESNRNASITDLVNYTPTNAISMYPYGGRINDTFIPTGGVGMNLPASGNPMTRGASLITTPSGSTSGSHEAGNNIPVIGKDGKPVAIAEPGEVVTNDGDMSLIISKRDGLAQQYTAIENQKQKLIEKIVKAKTPEARSGLTRSIEFLDKQLDAIKEQQRQVSEQMAQVQQSQANIPVAGDGIVFKPSNASYMLNMGNTNITKYNPYGLELPDLSFSSIPQINGLDLSLSDDWNYDAKPNESFDGINWDKTAGLISQGIGMILPSMMNYKNQKAMRDSMADIMAHRPIPNKINYIHPDFQIGDQIANINNSFAVSRSVADKVSSPLTASNIISDANAQRADNINKIIGEKNRADMQADFYQTNTINSISMNNVAALNANKNFQLESRLSQNNALINLNNTTAQSIYAMIQEGNLKERDKSTLMLAIKQLNQYGVIDRNLLPFLESVGVDITGVKTGTIPK